MSGAKTAGNNRTQRAANGGGGRGQQVEGVASVLIIFEIDGPADIPIKQTNKFPSEASALAFLRRRQRDGRQFAAPVTRVKQARQTTATAVSAGRDKRPKQKQKAPSTPLAQVIATAAAAAMAAAAVGRLITKRKAKSDRRRKRRQRRAREQRAAAAAAEPAGLDDLQLREAAALPQRPQWLHLQDCTRTPHQRRPRRESRCC